MMKKSPSSKARRSAARLMAVQAVYQMFMNGHDSKSIVEEYLQHRSGMDVEGEEMIKPDPDLFQTLTNGVAQHRAELEKIIKAARAGREDEQKAKTELLLGAVLFCGAYELKFHQDIDFPIIISDYLEVSKAFYDGKEPALVNAVLDKVRQAVRA
ncbi:MAG: transcription antitermination factor NusB [Rhodospirillales bacterium]|nr:transcription antitermination factor NusB [Alphaproteobacteria bacterium]USO03459.1 MAG: transcription antitermination factor NusB [Rhodospirillales bacterium]